MTTAGGECCPKCRTEFETRSAIVNFGQSEGLLNLPDIPPRVYCPKCHHAFKSSGTRYFGFITPRKLRIIVVIYVLALLVSVLGVFVR